MQKVWPEGSERSNLCIPSLMIHAYDLKLSL